MVNCPKCGAKIRSDTKFCEICRYPINVSTDGGAFVSGDVTANRDFIGRDKTTISVNIGSKITEYIADYINEFFFIFHRPIADFLSDTSLIVPPKHVVFMLLSVLIGATLYYIPSRDLDHPGPVSILVITFTFWFAYGTATHVFLKFIGGKGSLKQTLSLTLRVLNIAYVIGNFVALLWRISTQLPSIEVYYFSHFIFLVIFLTPALRKLHFTNVLSSFPIGIGIFILAILSYLVTDVLTNFPPVLFPKEPSIIGTWEADRDESVVRIRFLKNRYFVAEFYVKEHKTVVDQSLVGLMVGHWDRDETTNIVSIYFYNKCFLGSTFSRSDREYAEEFLYSCSEIRRFARPYDQLAVVTNDRNDQLVAVTDYNILDWMVCWPESSLNSARIGCGRSRFYRMSR